MKTENIFKGLGIALITPFTQDGQVDYPALIRLVNYQLDNGADFFCILATTGETPVLTPEEKLTIKNTVVDLVQGRVPILMGCGGYNTAAVIHELQTGDFKGGLILRRGNIEVNCTAELLVELCRGDMASELAQVLFG